MAGVAVVDAELPVAAEPDCASADSSAARTESGNGLELDDESIESSVVPTVLPVELPNNSPISCNCITWALSCTMSPGDAFSSADCTLGVDRALDSSGDASCISSWSRLANPGLVKVTEPKDTDLQIQTIGTFRPDFSRLSCSRVRSIHHFAAFQHQRTQTAQTFGLAG